MVFDIRDISHEMRAEILRIFRTCIVDFGQFWEKSFFGIFGQIQTFPILVQNRHVILIFLISKRRGSTVGFRGNRNFEKRMRESSFGAKNDFCENGPTGTLGPYWDLDLGPYWNLDLGPYGPYWDLDLGPYGP